MSMPPHGDSPPPVPTDAAQRGLRHWTVISVAAAVLILVFLLSR